MRKLLLLALVAAFPLTASAQWSFDSVFPADTLDTDGNGMHGVAVDPDGKVWLQTFGATDSVQVADLGNEFRPVRVVYVFNADGSEADISPIKFIEYADGVTPTDTLGGYVTRGSDGALTWEGRSNRGIVADYDGNIIISSFESLFKVDYQTGEGLAPRVDITPYCAATQPSTDQNNNVYIAPVCPGQPIQQYDSDLNFVANVTDSADNFSRSLLVSPDGNTVFETAFGNPFTIVHQRPDEFSPFDSVGITLAGMRVESPAINQSTGRYWFSAGNPLNGINDFNDIDPTTGDTLRTNYSLTTWYAFEPADLFNGDGNPVLNPTPVDSLAYLEPGDPPDGPGVGRPRGLAFSPDGDTAYVVLFNKAGAVQRFTRTGGTANEPGTFAGALEQNRPNPFAGETEIRFSLDRAATVSLRIFDAAGRQVATLANESLGAGPHSYTFEAGQLAAGVYIYTLSVDGELESRRMMVVR